MSLTRLMAFSVLTVCLGLPILPAAAQSGANQQNEPLRLKTDLVEVRAVVTDAHGRPIEQLKQNDFELLENGKAQSISFFSEEHIGAPAVGENAEAPRPGNAAPPGRSIVLYVDTLHLLAPDLPIVKRALTQFLTGQMNDRDLCAIITSSGMLGILEQFTHDRHILLHAVERLRAMTAIDDAPFSPYLASLILHEALTDVPGEATLRGMAILDAVEGPETDPGQRLQRVRLRSGMIADRAAVRRQSSLNTLKGVVEKLAAMPGQRLAVVFSPGFSMRDRLGAFDTSTLAAVTSRAARSGVIVYSIDAAGLQPMPGYDASKAVTDDGYEAKKENQNVLNALAKDTGGDFYFNSNDLSQPLKKVLDENRVYYTLAYYPALEKGDSKFRRLVIRVKDHPEYKVRTQKGFSPAEIIKASEKARARTPQEQMVQAMSAPLPVTGITVAASGDVLRAEGGDAIVALRVFIDGSVFESSEKDQKRRLELEAHLAIFDAQGKLVQSFVDDISGNLRPDRLEQARQNGLTHTRRMTLKPGLYHLRVGMRDPATERIGTAIAWIDVPDFRKAGLAMSSILLSERTVSQQGSAPDEFVQPGIAQGIQSYKRGSRLVYSAMVYETTSDTRDSNLQLQIDILSGERTVYQSPFQPLASRTVTKAKAGQEIGGQVVLEMAAGFYEIRLTVKDGRGKRTTVQTAGFRVL